MKTKSVARAGMLCGVYGVLLLMNTLTGFWVESIFPYLFALPILVLALKEDARLSLCALAAMLAMTFMLSGMTTWILAGSMLAAGWIFGYGIRRKISILTTSILCFILLFIISLLQLTLLAALFGFDGAQEKEMYQFLEPYISWNGLLVLLAVIEAFLETFAMAALTILLAFKLLKEPQIARLKLKVAISPWFAWIFCVIFPIWLLSISGMVSFHAEVKDCLFFAVLVCLIALIWQGARVLLQKIKPSRPFWQVMLVVLGAFLPGMNLAEAAVGLVSLLGQSVFRMRKKHEAI